MSPLRILRRHGRTWPAENSVALRAAASGAVCVAIAACAAQDELPPWFAAAAVALVCAGSVFSYRRRTRPLPYLKILLGASIFGAFAWFFVTISAYAASGQLSSVEGPLAVLFSTMQAAHAFDMPSRRDLGFSLAGSATLMALAGAQAIDLSFALYVVLWSVLALAGLHASWSSMAGGAAPRPSVVVASTAAALLVAALLVAFLPAPRPPGVSAAPGIGPTPAASATGQPSRLVPASGSVDQLAASASGPTGVGGFLGFAGPLDTALSPELGNELVLQVRADRPTYWVAETFDSWSGRSWSEIGPPHGATRGASDASGAGGAAGAAGIASRRLGSVVLQGGQPFIVAPEVVSPQRASERETPSTNGATGATSATGSTGSTGSTGTPTAAATAATAPQPDYQTFYLAAPASDLVLHADQATAVWIPTQRLYVGADDTIRTSETFGAGSVYSVESTVATPSDAELAKANGTAGLTPAVASQDLDLPRPYPRVAALAQRITAHDTTVISKIIALERWIGAHTKYTLDIPPLAPGQDSVVQFLFVTRRGFCEQISTSLAVMLRTLGIPAREAVGYVPGSFDPITGLYDEQAKDAHAWVQVWFPGYGWQSFDPTAYVPLANPSPASTIGHDVLAALHRVPVAPTASTVAVLALLAVAFAWRRRQPPSWSTKVTRELERAARRAGVRAGPGTTIGALAAALDDALAHGPGVPAPVTAHGRTPARREPSSSEPDSGWPDFVKTVGQSVVATADDTAGETATGKARRASDLAAAATAAAWGGGDVRPGAGRHYVQDARRLRRAARQHARR